MLGQGMEIEYAHLKEHAIILVNIKAMLLMHERVWYACVIKK